MFYIVKIKITPRDPKNPLDEYKSRIFKGEYVSKGKQAKKEKIEEQVKAFLFKNVTAQDPDMEFDIKVLNIDRYNRKFIVVEDKE